MSWGLFGQIVLLIVIFAIVRIFLKCVHDTYCIAEPSQNNGYIG